MIVFVHYRSWMVHWLNYDRVMQCRLALMQTEYQQLDTLVLQ
jgi:hypothetical protein